MNGTPRLPRAARIGLVLAALVHLLGVDLGAWIHVRGPAAFAAEAVVQADGESQAPLPSHPLDCALCHTLSHLGHALPASGGALVLPAAGPAPVAAAPAEAPRVLRTGRVRVRGPPRLS